MIGSGAIAGTAAPASKRRRWTVRRVGTTLGPLLPALVTGLVVLAALEVVHRSGVLPPILFPSPLDLFESMGRQATTATLWSNLGITVQESMVGFALGSAIGFVVGTAIALSRTVARGLYPYVVLVQGVPRVALAPYLIAILGFGMSSKVVIAILICFFPVLVNTITGLQQADEGALLLMRSLRATRWQIFRRVLLPGALPAIFGGMKTGVTLAFLGAIVGELIAANAGIGGLISFEAFRLEMANMFGYMLWFAAVAVAVFGAVQWLDRKIIFWTEDVRGRKG